MIKTWILGASALAMTALPMAASAAPVAANSAQSLSLSPSVRTSTPTKKSSKLAEGASVVPFVIGAAVLAGVAYLIIDKENDNSDSN